jgi:4-carboxymuconolactone decarboxylase
MSNEQYLTGLAMLQKIHGGHAGEAIVEGMGDISPKLVDIIINLMFGDIMQRKELDLKAREMAILSSLVTQGHPSPQIRAHIEAALNVGIKKEEIVEMFLLIGFYAGFPATVNAMAIAKDVFANWS